MNSLKTKKKSDGTRLSSVGNETFRNLTSSDLRQVAESCELIHDVNTNEPFSTHVQRVLGNVLDCIHFSFDRYQVRPLKIIESVAPVPAEVMEPFSNHIDQHPILAAFRDKPSVWLTTICNEIPFKTFQKTELYDLVYKELGLRDQLGMTIYNPQEIIGIVYSRDTVFTEREISIMRIIRPNMMIAWRNWARISDLEQRLQLIEEKNICSELDFEQAKAVKGLMDRLSRRQREVAELVAQGLQNRDIAHALHIAPGTVNKHLENIFLELNIHHRADLAARWQQYKLLGRRIRPADRPRRTN